MTYFSSNPDISKILKVTTPAVILAGATLLISFISYLWTPKKYIFLVSLIIYFLIAATTAALILNTGKTSSPYISLWMLVCIFAGVFGIWGVLPIFLATSAFIAFQYLNNNLAINVIIITILSSILPIIASIIIWHGKSAKNEVDSDEKAYRNLANELTAVTGKSEVVINAIGDGVIVIDNQGIIQLINPAAQNIIGWGNQDAVSLSYKSVLKFVNQKDEMLDIANDPIQQALNSNQEIRTSDLNLMTNSGKRITLSLVASPVGEIGSGVITVFHDVTSEKAEEREQAEFISTASHEMRTPVASIEGYLGLALNSQTSTIDSRARDFIMKAHESAEHLGHLFQDLLDVSKSDDGRLSNKPAVVNIVLFVHDIIQGLKQKATEKGLELVYKPMPDNSTERFIAPAYFVNLDNDHIREIVNNLVENAIKYTQKGEILIDISGDEDRIIISVKDSGVGIPAEDMPHLFQKFYRVENKSTREIGGTGLGLYLCRRLAEMMGGRIWVESTYNSGSTFFVELPRISAQDASRLTEQEATVALKEANDKYVAPPVETEPNFSNIPVPIVVTQEPVKPAPSPALSIPISTQIDTSISTLPPDTAQLPIISKPVPIPEPKKIPEPVPEVVLPPPEPKYSVPRGQSLTPEQIAAYVVKQRALAKQQAAPQLSRSLNNPVQKNEIKQ